ncbi:hypothetical protein GCM10009840_23360 [Pseudolysinimonas kribbensis]|uniref:Uncharacterized protein n=1 Tax=Pseudolysinimonas kribbensis TaxID=433641 RepID=A0ABQ6KEW1_9MICO|nr:hypothetical protein [Pseudolysinimonas kribbensis]GMA96917.1 hypothetical protein GCM10025881_37410 [Pseudolysinimonas kribbensis]
MASPEEIEAALAAASAPEWETPRDLNRISLEALFGGGAGARTLRSSGSLRLFGVNVTNHSARLGSTADVLAQLQRLVTAVGAARRGIRSTQGPLPGELVTLTALKIAAAPAGGSLVFDLLPESLPETELLTEGNVAIFDQAQRQFLDECFEDALRLVGAAHSIGPDADAQPEQRAVERAAERAAVEPLDGIAITTNLRIVGFESDEESAAAVFEQLGAEVVAPTTEQPASDLEALLPDELETAKAQAFIERVREGGPRLATAVRKFAKAIESADFDVDLEWREPNTATRRATFTQHDARLVRHLVVSRELEVDTQEVTGRLITLSEKTAWQLAVGSDDETIVRIDASKLTKAVREAFHLNQLVTIKARTVQRSLPGGGITTTFQAVTVTSNEVPST